MSLGESTECEEFNSIMDLPLTPPFRGDSLDTGGSGIRPLAESVSDSSESRGEMEILPGKGREGSVLGEELLSEGVSSFLSNLYFAEADFNGALVGRSA